MSQSRLSLPADFAAKIAETFNWPLARVQDTFSIEAKDTYLYARLKPKKFLDKPDFHQLCLLVKKLGGEEYVIGSGTWRIPLGTKTAIPPNAEKSPGPMPIEIKPAYYEAFPIAAILSPKFTLRLDIEKDIQELVEQISTTEASGQKCVILEPLVCRPAKKGGYVELAAGERRLYSARKLGLTTVSVVVLDLSDEEFDRIRAMENFARKDLTDYETGRLLKYLMDTYPKTYPTQAVIADIFGKDQSWVSRHLSMLEVEPIMPRGIMEKGELTEGQTREILAAPPEKQEEIIDKINKTGVVPSGREIRAIAKGILCAKCGEPIKGTPIYLTKDKCYDAQCAEHVIEESKKGLIKESPHSKFDEEEEFESEEKKEPEEQPQKEHEPLDKDAIQIGEFDCTECGKHFFIDHLPNGDHALRLVTEAKT